MNDTEFIKRIEAEVKGFRNFVNQSLTECLLCEIDKKKQSIPSERECRQVRRRPEERAKYSAPNRGSVTPDSIENLRAYMDSLEIDTLEFHRRRGVFRIGFRMGHAKGRGADPYSEEMENYMDLY